MYRQQNQRLEWMWSCPPGESCCLISLKILLPGHLKISFGLILFYKQKVAKGKKDIHHFLNSKVLLACTHLDVLCLYVIWPLWKFSGLCSPQLAGWC